jgi:hypothetical protein
MRSRVIPVFSVNSDQSDPMVEDSMTSFKTQTFSEWTCWSTRICPAQESVKHVAMDICDMTVQRQIVSHNMSRVLLPGGIATQG